MALYKLKDTSAAVYAREPKDIVDLIHYYHTREGDALITHPSTKSWVKKIPDDSDIELVEQGSFTYHVGNVRLPTTQSEGELPYFEELCVLPDFTVYISPQSAYEFRDFRDALSTKKRGNLFKVQVDHLFGGLTFIPEDVMQAVVEFDLVDLLMQADNLQG